MCSTCKKLHILCICKKAIGLNVVNDQPNCRNRGCHSKERKKNNVDPMPQLLF